MAELICPASGLMCTKDCTATWGQVLALRAASRNQVAAMATFNQANLNEANKSQRDTAAKFCVDYPNSNAKSRIVRS